MRAKFPLFFPLLILLGLYYSGLNAQIRSGNSNGLECAADLTIRQFLFADLDVGQATAFDWKVVVGRDIDYRARPGGNGTWTWQLGRDSSGIFLDKWNVMPTQGSLFRSRSNANDKAIMSTDGMPRLNTGFGPLNGEVRVKNSHQGNNWRTLTDPPGSRVEVFFEKDETSNPEGNDPNWFYYWTQSPLVQNLLTIPGIHLYDDSVCRYDPMPTPVTLSIEYDGTTFPYNPNGSNTYGANKFAIRGGTQTQVLNQFVCNVPNQNVAVGYESFATKIILGQGCGFLKATDHCTPVTNYEGIHTLYTTVAHEVEHVRIDCEVWRFTHPSDTSVKGGFSTIWDKDLDGYKDLWEENSPDAFIHGFDYDILNPKNDDIYNPRYNYNPQNPVPGSCDLCQNNGGPVCSAGTRFEEKRCRAVEAALNLMPIDGHDWSFDPTDMVQGKQWK